VYEGLERRDGGEGEGGFGKPSEGMGVWVTALNRTIWKMLRCKRGIGISSRQFQSFKRMRI